MKHYFAMLCIIVAMGVMVHGAWGQTNYYSNGNQDVTNVNNWWTNTDGTGSHPTNFATANQVFNVQNGHMMTASAVWTVSGSGSKVVIKSGGQITSGSFNHSLTLDMESGGTWIHSHTTYGNLTFGSLNSNSNFQMNNSSGFSPSRTYPNLILNFSSSINPGANSTTINGNLDIRSGADFRGTTTGTPTHTIGGNVLISAGGIWTLSNGSGSPTYNISGTITNNGSIVAAAANGTSSVNLNGSNSVTVTWGTKSGHDHNVTIASTKTVVFADNFQIDVGTLAVAGTLATAGTLTNNSTTTITGTFQINQGGFASGNDFVYSSTLVFNNSSGSYGVNSGHVYWPATNGPTNVTVQGAGGITMNVARTVSGTFQTSATVTNGHNLTLSGTVQLNSGGFFASSPVFSGNATLVYKTGYGVTNEWVNGGTVGSGVPKNVTIDAAAGTVSLPNGGGNRTVVGDLTITSGTLLLGNSIGDDFLIGGNWTRSGGTFTPNSRAVTFNGSANQSVTGTTTFDYLTISNSGGNITLNNDIDVNQNLTFNAGNLVLGTSKVFLGTSATITGAAAGKCVVTNSTGALYRNIAPGGSFQFAVGPSTTLFNPVSIALNPLDAGSELFNVRVIDGVSPSAPDNSLCVQRSWDISESTPGGNSAALTFQWAAADEGLNFARSLSSTFHYSTAQSRYFDVAFNTPATGSNPYSVSTVGGYPATEFSVYIVGASGGLPVQLSSFTGTLTTGNRVRLDWRTTSELNNYGFYVQRRLAGATVWNEIPNSFIPGHGTTSLPQQYTFTDNTPLISATEYRLKQVDLDGTENFSEPIAIDNPTSVVETAPKQFALLQNYPNPFNPSTEIKFSVADPGLARLVVYNSIGQEVVTLFNEMAEPGRYYQVRFTANGLSSGMYFYRLTSGKQTDLKKLMLIK